MNRRLFRVMLVRAHPERAALDEDHVGPISSNRHARAGLSLSFYLRHRRDAPFDGPICSRHGRDRVRKITAQPQGLCSSSQSLDLNAVMPPNSVGRVAAHHDAPLPSMACREAHRPKKWTQYRSRGYPRRVYSVETATIRFHGELKVLPFCESSGAALHHRIRMCHQLGRRLVLRSVLTRRQDPKWSGTQYLMHGSPKRFVPTFAPHRAARRKIPIPR